MAFVTINNVAFRGLASAVPKNKVSNLDVEDSEKSERERLVRNIGINTRRLCAPDICLSDLAQEAGEKLISEVGWKKEDIEALIVVTQTPDYLIPGNAIITQHRMGLPKSCIAFDINLGCSGYPFGIYTVASMLSSGGIKKALLLVGDRSGSKNDPLFSDCGTATLLEFSPGAPPMHFDLNSDGEGYRAIILPVGGGRTPVRKEHLIPKLQADGKMKADIDLILDGPAVLSFSTQRVPPAVNSVLDKLNINKNEIDYFFFHQANKMINSTISKKLGLAEDKVPTTLSDFGNTSSASIPITMTVRCREALEGKRNKVLMCGFGIGLSWGTAVIEIENAKFLELIEI